MLFAFQIIIAVLAFVIAPTNHEILKRADLALLRQNFEGFRGAAFCCFDSLLIAPCWRIGCLVLFFWIALFAQSNP